MSGSDYASWKVADLKAALKGKGLPVSGNKQDLIERLQASLLDDGDDLLDQDDSMTEEAILKAEEELKVTKATEKVAEPSPVKTAPTPVTSKNDLLLDTAKAASDKENAGDSTNTSPVKVVSKPTEEEVEAKIKARAERFGGFQGDEAKKIARAAKFGTGTAATNGSSKLGGAPSADIDTLKKRAERFGTSTSTSLKKAEVNDAIKRRQERFGVVDKNEPKPKKINFNSGVNSVVVDEKMKSRAQRFGLA